MYCNLKYLSTRNATKNITLEALCAFLDKVPGLELVPPDTHLDDSVAAAMSKLSQPKQLALGGPTSTKAMEEISSLTELRMLERESPDGQGLGVLLSRVPKLEGLMLKTDISERFPQEIGLPLAGCPRLTNLRLDVGLEFLLSQALDWICRSCAQLGYLGVYFDSSQ